MSFQIPGMVDRVYVPDEHGDHDYRAAQALVSMLRVLEKGPDVQCLVTIRGIPAGSVLIPRGDEGELRRRLFSDPPAGDAETVGTMLQELEDCAAAHDIEGTRLARRRLAAFIGQLRAAAAATHPEATHG